MHDIVIIVGRTGKAVISGLTSKGLYWIKSNMTQESPVTVDAEHINEIKEMIETDRLTINVR